MHIGEEEWHLLVSSLAHKNRVLGDFSDLEQLYLRGGLRPLSAIPDDGVAVGNGGPSGPRARARTRRPQDLKAEIAAHDRIAAARCERVSL